MAVVKTMVSFGAETHLVDTIDQGGRAFLVPAWVDATPAGTRRPLRIIPLSRVHHQTLDQIATARYLVTSPLPAELFGPGPLSDGLVRRFGAVENPDIRYRGDETAE